MIRSVLRQYNLRLRVFRCVSGRRCLRGSVSADCRLRGLRQMHGFRQICCLAVSACSLRVSRLFLRDGFRMQNGFRTDAVCQRTRTWFLQVWFPALHAGFLRAPVWFRQVWFPALHAGFLRAPVWFRQVWFPAPDAGFLRAPVWFRQVLYLRLRVCCLRVCCLRDGFPEPGAVPEIFRAAGCSSSAAVKPDVPVFFEAVCRFRPADGLPAVRIPWNLYLSFRHCSGATSQQLGIFRGPFRDEQTVTRSPS